MTSRSQHRVYFSGLDEISTLGPFAFGPLSEGDRRSARSRPSRLDPSSVHALRFMPELGFAGPWWSWGGLETSGEPYVGPLSGEALRSLGLSEQLIADSQSYIEEFCDLQGLAAAGEGGTPEAESRWNAMCEEGKRIAREGSRQLPEVVIEVEPEGRFLLDGEVLAEEVGRRRVEAALAARER